jgi:hypothetical protein
VARLEVFSALSLQSVEKVANWYHQVRIRERKKEDMCLYAHVAYFSEAELSDLVLRSGCAVHLTGTNATLPCPKMHY